MSESEQWISTARLLRRTGFGATGPQIDAVVKKDWSAYLDAGLNSDPEADPGAKATPPPKLDIPPSWRPGDSEKALADFNLKHYHQMNVVRGWWLRRMAAVEQPIHEKLTLLWHNHFATSQLKVLMAHWMLAQNEKLRELKLGDFRTLAYTMLTDAAMLRWLDGNLNTAGSPNENLAREFMELFALGHGNGYTEADVKQGARALTGWTAAYDGKTYLNPSNHDSGQKTVLGVAGNLDAAGFCDAVLAHPDSARYVAGRLWRQLASNNAPSPEALDRMMTAYGPGRDLKALTTAILTDREFISQPGTMVNTPVEWLMGLIRTLSVRIDDIGRLEAVAGTLGKLGQQPFYPPDVGGWPSGRMWLSTASTGIRTWAASQLADLGDLSTVHSASKSDRIDAVGYLIGVGAWTDRSIKALKPLTGDPKLLLTGAVNTPEYVTS
jgi:uncharacterized protein (DUF1800 family)